MPRLSDNEPVVRVCNRNKGTNRPGVVFALPAFGGAFFDGPLVGGRGDVEARVRDAWYGGRPGVTRAKRARAGRGWSAGRFLVVGVVSV